MLFLSQQFRVFYPYDYFDGYLKGRKSYRSALFKYVLQLRIKPPNVCKAVTSPSWYKWVPILPARIDSAYNLCVAINSRLIYRQRSQHKSNVRWGYRLESVYPQLISRGWGHHVLQAPDRCHAVGAQHHSWFSANRGQLQRRQHGKWKLLRRWLCSERVASGWSLRSLATFSSLWMMPTIHHRLLDLDYCC